MACWRAGNEVAGQLASILEEAAGDVQQLEPAFRNSGAVVRSTYGLIYRLFHFERVSVGLGFWPRREQPSPNEHAVLTAGHFTAQVEQVVAYLRDSLGYFRSLGCLDRNPA